LDGASSNATFNTPSGVAVDSFGNVFVADSQNNIIRKIAPDGTVSTLAGRPGAAGYQDGTGTNARFRLPTGIAVDQAGNIYVAEMENNDVREITPDGAVTTIAGSGANGFGFRDGQGTNAFFGQPRGVAVDPSGNLYVADTGNDVIRKITPAGEVSTLAGEPGNPGSRDGPGPLALFNSPAGVAVATNGLLYVVDSGGGRVRVISPDGNVTTLAGFAGASTDAADGAGTNAIFADPEGVAVDQLGNIYVTDRFASVVHAIAPSGLVSTLAGMVRRNYFGDGTGSSALFNRPWGLAVDAGGTLYVADSSNQTIRRGTPPALQQSLPSITVQPQNQVVPYGMSAIFSVTAAGSPPLSFIWLANNAVIPGSTNAALVLTNVSRASAGGYAVTVSNTLGSAVSSNALLRVKVPQVLLPPQLAAGDSLLLQFQDLDGMVASLDYATNFQIQISTNLLDWRALSGPVRSTNGYLLFEDNNSSNLPDRFYRIVEP
jgi:sugar lactone lactonase YvrE